MKLNYLNNTEQNIIINKGTEAPFSGKFLNNNKIGTYLCRQCNAPLYFSEAKFQSSCGWPSFDDEIKNAIKRQIDADGHRTEILCNNCNAHLGHIFENEGFTDKNIRHCVNSISLDFIPIKCTTKLEQAVFASGCFWGTEFYMQKAKGVISTTVGYSGGHINNPTYEQVCAGKTGHRECVRVFYDPQVTNYEKLTKLFFETHDPSQDNGQGPDIGEQYKSTIFYLNDEQKNIANSLIKTLSSKGINIATELFQMETFWSAEEFHQDYYNKNGNRPYCHSYKKLF